MHCLARVPLPVKRAYVGLCSSLPGRPKIAYTCATLFYQTATWARHPTSSALWLLGPLLFAVAVIVLMRNWVRKEVPPLVQTS